MPTRPTSRREATLRFALCLLVGTALLCTSSSRARPLAVSDTELRAMIVLRLLQFSRWQGQDQAEICVIGDKAIGQQLRHISQRGSKDIAVHNVNMPPPASCSVLILGPKTEVLDIKTTQSKFLICSGCASKDIAAIHLYRHGDKIQFDINQRAAKNSGVHFRSSVLKAASNVEGGI
ncbi:YfiR family protein [Agaribacterium haliotis]|uniref:YfiR family protein n=1 Tax=Agaribacterium haliotis TaxID=2013869 RepID=UPI000BB552D4|nr:YfiR family protein [Agaribacterium haliotis]